MKFFYPLPSLQHPKHYSTFLEMCNKKPKDLPVADQHLPSVQESELGRCSDCPEYVFLSKTEKKRHLQVFHPQKRKPRQQKSPASGGKFQCMYKLGPKDMCGAKFPTTYQLRKHRKEAKHQRKKKHQKTPVAPPEVSQYVTRVMQAIATAEETDETEVIAAETPDEAEEDEAEDAGNSASEEDEAEDAGNSASEEEDEAGNSASEGEDEAEGAGNFTSEEEEEFELEQQVEHAEGTECCIMCGLTEDDDEESEIWIECTMCLEWIHKSCLPPRYCQPETDEHFVCPECSVVKRRKLI